MRRAACWDIDCAAQVGVLQPVPVLCRAVRAPRSALLRCSASLIGASSSTHPCVPTHQFLSPLCKHPLPPTTLPQQKIACLPHASHTHHTHTNTHKPQTPSLNYAHTHTQNLIISCAEHKSILLIVLTLNNIERLWQEQKY